MDQNVNPQKLLGPLTDFCNELWESISTQVRKECGLSPHTDLSWYRVEVSSCCYPPDIVYQLTLATPDDEHIPLEFVTLSFGSINSNQMTARIWRGDQEPLDYDANYKVIHLTIT